ncbi:MAG TPA: hypothetical protein VKB50_13930 [Vicinamibacterales bacterium]|nr:hypothetical protein [Vicinamibacterales bacterium]
MKISRTCVIGIAAALALFATTPGNGQIVPRQARCLHDAGETAVERTRREQALAVARAINMAEGVGRQQTGRYQPLASLANVPAVPDGFVVRFYSDENGYVFSLKDSRDLCRYGIFSDQSGTVYSLTPTVALMASN